MNINATIIVQAGNFFIVYVLLRYFLFKPAVAILDHEQVQKSLVIAAIDQHKKSLEIQEKERQRHWRACQEYFIMHRPSTSLLHLYNAESLDVISFPHVPSEKKIQELTKEVYDTLEEKIKNVH